MHEAVLARIQHAVPAWRGLAADDFDFDAPKGFSSITMGVRARVAVEPAAVLYRQLEGNENAILDFTTERSTFLLLGEAEIAAPCLHYDRDYRIEEFYSGRSLTAADVFDPAHQRGVADELYRLHQLEPPNLPEPTNIELLHYHWGQLARRVLGGDRSAFPADEQALFAEIETIFSDATLARVLRCLPDGPPVFCHNDTYHGNVFLLDDGTVRLLEVEFS